MKWPSLLGLAVLGLLAGVPSREPAGDVNAGTALRLELVDLVDAADLVLEARVREARVVETPQGRIETEYVLEVDRTFWGDDLALRTVRLPGGVLPDGRGLVLPGMATLQAGEEALLFLSHPGATGVRVPVGLAQGKLSVVTELDGRRSLIGESSLLATVDARSGAVDEAPARAVLNYAETIAELRAAAERRALTGSARGGAR
ncbi:MAG: hypothetical protein H6828_09200 [Planctomycetes bacterium]|nr:hypothetical protein [Planctomycetota bacterium]